ncbi:hypothetical protein SDRG_15062 [Saprolegnia diclina VS20]|uniref:Uncharacterized protein n=1 Tax=Saprolegnia diclina (strain VS20) TaxID=1156394 RepID=T0Q1B2_SAPDV|nr:hypothetical protein SDRG_15062 [Saprolegnia diclina VS20]EQC27160.1 hypothetical protein SDRG_15062 [Saprolegnia diclina VS20]|eukprot:XP_008619446.1 hypothetical protein SDRG_15062 [Saprolegnia diclina VS20]
METMTLARATAEADLRTKEEALQALEDDANDTTYGRPTVRLQLRVLWLKPPLVHLQCQLSSSTPAP